MPKAVLDIASFGSEYQEDLTEHWIKPAADKCDIGLTPHPPDFLGVRTTEIAGWGYPGFCERLRAGGYPWDLVHVEDHCVHIPEAADTFATFPNRIINGLPDYLHDPRAVPVCQGYYALAWHRDAIDAGTVPTWEEFFDPDQIPGARGIRDFPTSNIEIALLSLGRDVHEVLYDERLSREQVEVQVRDALAQFEKLKDHTAWWHGGFESHRHILDGEVVMSAMWNRRVMSANQEACPTESLDDLVVLVDPASAVLICDWWLIPKGTGHEHLVNELLECMYNDAEALRGAARWSVLQQNLVPIDGVVLDDDFARYFLELGTWKNSDAPVKMDTRFWGRHFAWIGETWRDWRVRFGHKSADAFTTSAPPPRRKTG